MWKTLTFGCFVFTLEEVWQIIVAGWRRVIGHLRRESLSRAVGWFGKEVTALLVVCVLAPRLFVCVCLQNGLALGEGGELPWSEVEMLDQLFPSDNGWWVCCFSLHFPFFSVCVFLVFTQAYILILGISCCHVFYILTLPSSPNISHKPEYLSNSCCCKKFK